MTAADPSGEDGRRLDSFSESVLRVLVDAMKGNLDSAVGRFEATCPTPRDGFAACCGFANIITDAGIAASHPTAVGPVIVELERLPGPPSKAIDDLAVSDIAGFLGAVGNKDYEGAYTVFDEACCSNGNPLRGPKFLANLLMMTVAVARHSGGDAR